MKIGHNLKLINNGRLAKKHFFDYFLMKFVRAILCLELEKNNKKKIWIVESKNINFFTIDLLIDFTRCWHLLM